MSVEGPSVDDVAAVVVEFTRTTGDGFVLFSDEVRELGIAAYPKEVAALAEAVHALYAPVLADLVQDRDEWEAVAQTERRRTAAAEADVDRYREALEYYADRANYEESGRTKPPWGDGEMPIEEDGGLIARAALVGPKGESQADGPSALQGEANANPKGQD